MYDVIDYNDALKIANRLDRKHLLLGNGFSIAKFPTIFSYGSLFDKADFTKIPQIEGIFSMLGTQDFEAAIKMLQDTAKIIDLYGASASGIADKIRHDSENLKNILLDTIAKRHPAGPFDIDEDSYWHCKKFLQPFLKPERDGRIAGHVYTLNYDLMLYWTLMHEMKDESRSVLLDPTDAFGRDGDSSDGFVVYNGYKQSFFQRIHYMHGALHLFDTDTDIKKNTWNDTGIRLIDQTRDALDRDYYPIFVAEGESRAKLTKIKHNSYLSTSYDQFRYDMEKIRSNYALFIFGHSLNSTDDHILIPMIRGRIAHIFVSVFGDPSSESNKTLFANWERLEKLKGSRSQTAITFYSAASANVWG